MTSSMDTRKCNNHRNLLRWGIQWILGNGKSINFCYDKWLDGSPLVHNINPNMAHIINNEAKVSDFIIFTKQSNLNNLTKFFQINKIKTMPIDVEDKLVWKFTTNGEFSPKTTTCANNDFYWPSSKNKIS